MTSNPQRRAIGVKIIGCLQFAILGHFAACNTGCSGSAPSQAVNEQLKSIIADCRGGELKQIPSKPGTAVLCDGINCPNKTITDGHMPKCERSFKYKVKIDKIGEQECNGTATLTTTEHKICSHNHQGTCDTQGECATEYVYETALVTAEAKLACTITINGTPTTVDASAQLGGYNKDWQFYEKKEHGGSRTCGPSPTPTATPTATPTTTPTPTPTRPPGDDEPQPTPEPTDSPEPEPTATAEPEPTATPEPWPTATPEPWPTAPSDEPVAQPTPTHTAVPM